MRKINTRVLVFTILFLGFFATGLHFMHGAQVGRQSGAFLRQAERAKQEERYGDSLKNYQRYVNLRPEDTGAMAAYGELLVDTGRIGLARGILEQVLRREPDRADLRRKLVEVLIAIGRPGDAALQLEAHLLPGAPTDAELLKLLANCQFALNKHAEALATTVKILEASPNDLEAYGMAIELQGKHLEKQLPAAVATADRMVAVNPELAEAYAVRSQFRRRYALEEPLQASVGVTAGEDEKAAIAKVFAAAESDLQRSLQLSPDDPKSLLLAASWAMEASRLDEAESFFKRAMELAPKTPGVYSGLSSLESRRQSPAAAMKWLINGLEVLPGNYDLSFSLANLQIEQGMTADAEKTVESLRKQARNPELLRYLQGRLFMQKQEWLKAIDALSEARNSFRISEEFTKTADFLLGECYRQVDEPDRQLEAYRQATAADPLWTRARVALASALVANQKLDEALQQYRQIITLPNAPAEVLVDMARLLVYLNLSKEPKSRNWQAVSQLLDEAEKQLPQSVAVPVLRAEAEYLQGNTAAAELVLQEARNARPEESPFWVASAMLASRGDDGLNKAVQLLDEAEEHVGDSVDLRLARARFLDDSPAALESLKLLAKPLPKYDASERLRLFRGLSPVAMRMKQFDLAVKLAEPVAQADDNDLPIRLLLFELALKTGNTDLLKEILVDLEDVKSARALYHYGQAVRQLVEAEDDPEGLRESLLHVELAARERPRWSTPPAMAGYLLEKLRREGDALESYLRAIELGQRNVGVCTRAVYLLNSRGLNAQADSVIRKMQEQKTVFSPELSRFATTLSLRLDDYDRALDLIQPVAKDSLNYQDHLLHGQALAVSGKLKEAEVALKRAISLGKGAPEPWFAMIRFLVQTDRLAEAKNLIQRARQEIADEEKDLVVARLLELTGQMAEAEQLWESLLEKQPDSLARMRDASEFYLKQGKLQNAEPLLKRITAAGETEYQDWGRRNLSLIFLSRRRYSELKQAEAMLRKNLLTKASATSPDDSKVADRRLLAMVLAERPEPECRDEAIKILRELTDSKFGSRPDDQFLLAKILWNKGDVSEARRLFVSLVNAGELKPRGRSEPERLAAQQKQQEYLRVFVRLLLDSDSKRTAGEWVNRLRQLSPDDAATIQLAARFDFINSRYDQILQSLSRHVEADLESPQDQRQLFAGSLLSSFARDLRKQNETSVMVGNLADAAAGYLNTYFEKHPEEKLIIAVHDANIGRHSEALAALKNSIAELEPRQAIAVSSAIMESHDKATSVLQELLQILQQMAKDHPDSTALHLAVADLHGWLGQTSSARAIYLELLARNSQELVVLNNLAVLNAFEKRSLNESLAMLDTAIKLAGPQSALLDSKAMVLLAAIRNSEAADMARRAIATKDAASHRFHLAQALAREGKQDEAAREFARAKDLDISVEALHPLERPAYLSMETSLR